MGSEAEKPETASLSLMEALEQAVLLNEHNTSMGVRLQALREQLDHARHTELRDALEAEEKTLRHTMEVVTQQISAMKKYFDTTVVEVNGHSMTAMDAFAALQIVIGQRNQLQKMVEGLNLRDCGFPRLKDASTMLRENLVQTLEAWKHEVMTLGTMLTGIVVPMDRRNVFQSIWITKTVKIQLVWNAEEKCFEPPPKGVKYDPDLQRFVDAATANFTHADSISGTTFTVEATSDERGRRFSGKVSRGTSAPGAPPSAPKNRSYYTQ